MQRHIDGTIPILKMKKLARRQSDEGQTKKLKPRKEDEDGSGCIWSARNKPSFTHKFFFNREVFTAEWSGSFGTQCWQHSIAKRCRQQHQYFWSSRFQFIDEAYPIVCVTRKFFPELFASPGTDYGDLDHVAMKSGVTSSFILNPIDKLYSMQSSYFTVDWKWLSCYFRISFSNLKICF